MLTRAARSRLQAIRQNAHVHRVRGRPLDYAYRQRPVTTVTIPPSADDTALIPFFDNPHVQRLHVSKSSGLFLHRSLLHPSSIMLLAQGSLQRAQWLTDRILRARESRGGLLLVLKNLDKLSDILCGAIDLAEVIRSSHPDRSWVENANAAYNLLCEYMNELNTHVGLYEVCHEAHSLCIYRLSIPGFEACFFR